MAVWDWCWGVHIVISSLLKLGMLIILNWWDVLFYQNKTDITLEEFVYHAYVWSESCESNASSQHLTSLSSPNRLNCKSWSKRRTESRVVWTVDCCTRVRVTTRTYMHHALYVTRLTFFVHIELRTQASSHSTRWRSSHGYYCMSVSLSLQWYFASPVERCCHAYCDMCYWTRIH